MLPFKEYGTGESTLVFMPFLGGSQQEWLETIGLLSGTYRCIAVDLPGFGEAENVPGYSVSDMVDAIMEVLSSLRLSRYVLVGHSMAGKVSAVATRRLIMAGPPLVSPAGIVLVAPSPPGPEPMSDSKRNEMLACLGNEIQTRSGRYSDRDRPAAEQFIRDNIAASLSETAFRRTVDDVLKMNPAAWTAWLESGSKEDWRSFVGVVDLPTLVVAGKEDEALGPDAQRTHTLPHFQPQLLAELECSHLIPLEKPRELAALITNFLEQVVFGACPCIQ